MERAKIDAFVAEHHLLSLATSGERLWCCSAFYAYDAAGASFIIASDEATEHIANVLRNPSVTGTVALETKTVGKIRGIQFAGRMARASDEEARRLYFGRFPYARAMNPTLWRIELDEVKMTDNTLGFGKKLTWKRSVSE
ncbi:MAG: pyridoxamine 5'-phosphate oxidase family protein [Campylobacterota bacterium]